MKMNGGARRLMLAVLVALASGGNLLGQDNQAITAGTSGAANKWATIEAHDNNIPVYAYGYTYVYGVSPDYQTNVILQEGNDATASKVQPKKSWEITNNLFGSTPPREPRSAANDDQPLLSVHLIDGDVRSSWASRGQNQADVEPEWIRIDLPHESFVDRVVLVGHPEGMGLNDPKWGVVKVGQAFPKALDVRTSRDGWHWDTVYKTTSYVPQDVKGRNEISFNPRWVKQVMVVGSNLPLTHYLGHTFSISEIEVLDREGQNLARLSRGAGVEVSSTYTGYGMDRFTQDMLWATQYDLGFKWSRVGYDMSYFQWAYVEREKGTYKVDPRAEAAITEAAHNGIQIVMTLDKNNWAYTPTPKKVDRTRDLVETYSNDPGNVTQIIPGLSASLDDTEIQGYLNYVRFMVRHFKDRVKYFEVWNEWGPYTYDGARSYTKVLKPAVKVIREEFPEAKIMPASTGWIADFEDRDKIDFGWYKALGDEGLLSQVDLIGIHPFYDPSPVDPYLRSFPEDFARFKKLLAGYGFKGEYMASEWDFFSEYPPSDLPDSYNLVVHSEIQKAIYGAQLSIRFAHLGIVNLWNETFQTMVTSRGLSLFRNTVSGEVICPTQPEPIYYMLRTLSTVLEDTKGADFPVRISSDRQEIEHYAFVRGNGEKLMALWLRGAADEQGRTDSNTDTTQATADVFIDGIKVDGPTIVDLLNGTEKPLRVESRSNGMTIRKIRVQNWPLIIRLK